MENEHLRAGLKLINPSQRSITSKQLYNFRLWASTKIARRKKSEYHKSAMTKNDLSTMFEGKGASKPESNNAIKFADELYGPLLKDTLESLDNMWKVEQYLKTLRRMTTVLTIGEEKVLKRVLLQKLSGKLELTLAIQVFC